MRHSQCSRADLLYALLSGRDEAVDFMADSLGFFLKPDEPQGAAKADVDIPLSLSIPQNSSFSLQQLPDVPFWRMEAFEFYPSDEIATFSQSEAAQVQQTWQISDEPARAALAPWSYLVPRLRRELTHTLLSARIDMTRILRCMSRAEVMSKFPRQSRCGWGSELQVIVDRSISMVPYGPDQLSLCAEFARLFPRQSICYTEYRQGDTLPIMSGQRGEARRYRLPAPGSLVIALTDLGLWGDKSERRLWQQLGQQLQQNQCRALALIPTDAPPVNTVLQRYWRCIAWARRSGPQDQQQAKRVERLLVLVSPATRIEPGFLRQVRQLIGADASTEAAVWLHPALISRSSVAATIDPEIAKELRVRFELEDEAIRKKVLQCLRNWRSHLSKEIWYEEIVGLISESQCLIPDKNELTQAYQFFDNLSWQVMNGQAVAGIYSWFHGLEQRLPKSVWQNQQIQPALHRLWWGTHQGETDVTPPVGYNPKNIPSKTNNAIRTFQLYQKANKLQVLEAEPSQGLIHEVNHGSWLGQIQSRNGEIVVAPVPQDDFWVNGKAPTWASDWGEDEYGFWVEFKLDYDGGVVTQRLRWIAPGQFMMGSRETEIDRYDNEGPRHQVTISQGYWMFDTTVTQALWLAVMGDNPSRFQGDDRPVEQVSWDDCQQFIKKLNDLKPRLDLNLPMEAQWEYACRAGIQTAFNFGEQISPEQANYNGSHSYARGGRGIYRQETVNVKMFQPNAWGLYQMHGNVREWCLDGKQYYGLDSVVDPLGTMEESVSRIVRGGSWSNSARNLRSAFRHESYPGHRSDHLGLRCARSQEAAQPLDPWRRRSGTRRPAADRSGVAVRVVLSQDIPQAQLAWPNDGDFVIRSDLGELLLRQLHCPPWANTIGRDRFGLWTEFELESEFGKVRQRLRWIPPGRFMMGSPESEHGGLAKDDDEREWFTIEGPQHLVTISRGYWLFDTPVTQVLWQAVMGENPSKFKSTRRPVENVSWDDANTFINKLNDNIPGLLLSLPTEAQWEYACRANTQTSTYYGELEIIGERNAPVLDDIAWYGGNSGVGFDLEEGYDSSDWPEKQYDHVKAGTREVALKKPNGWGLYDMLGNVWEWCMDGQRTYEDTAEVEPMGDLKEGASRVVRGGAWGDDARGLRAALRNANDPDVRYYFLGLRCARVQVDQEQGRQGTQPRHGQGSVAERRPDRGEAE